MSFTNLSLVFAFFQCALLIASGLIFLTSKSKWVSKEMLFFLLLCIGFNAYFYFESHFADFHVVVGYFFLAFEALILKNFVRTTAPPIGVLATHMKSKNVLFALYVLTCLLVFLSYFLCTELLQVVYPEVYAHFLSGIACILSVLFLTVWDPSWRKTKMRNLLILLALIAIVFIATIYYESEIVILILVNLLLLFMLLFNKLRASQDDGQPEYAKLEDYALTKRQKEVAFLMLLQLSYAEIADRLHIAENTASKHGSDIFVKTQCTDKINFHTKFYQYYRQHEKTAYQREDMLQQHK